MESNHAIATFQVADHPHHSPMCYLLRHLAAEKLRTQQLVDHTEEQLNASYSPTAQAAEHWQLPAENFATIAANAP